MDLSISIIIPVYNVEKYIRRCIESIMTQDIAGADVECIIVDDYTPDNSMTIAKEMIDAYQGSINFKLLRHEKNRGLSAARNTGVDHASGDYIFFIDSDDWIMPGCLQYFTEQLAEHPDVDLIIGNVLEAFTQKHYLRHLQAPRHIDDKTEFMRLMVQEKIYRQAWNKLIRKDVLTTHHIAFIEGIVYEDFPWSFELFLHVNSILLLPRITYQYEYVETSIVNTSHHSEKADRTVASFSIGVSRILELPLSGLQNTSNLQVDCILYLAEFLNKGIEILIHIPVQSETKKLFKSARMALLKHSLYSGRILLTMFLLLLFSPFCYLQKSRWFRHHYYIISQIVSRLSHTTDFLH